MIALPSAPVTPLIPRDEDGGHWYHRNGKTFYEVQSKDGTWRAPTLRDARLVQAVPSFSGISKVLANPVLDNWKKTQFALALTTLPRIRGESEEEFIARAVADADAQSIKARDIGSAIHDATEKSFLGEPFDPAWAMHVAGAAEALEQWCGLEGIIAEKSFAHVMGYGGKCDVHKPGPVRTLYASYIADFKTKDYGLEDVPKLKTYRNHWMQLAAYREGLGIPTAQGAIIYVSTRIPGLTHLVEIDEVDLEYGWRVFCAALKLWQEVNRYFCSFDDCEDDDSIAA